MNREAILERLADVVKEIICNDNAEVTEEMNLIDDLGLDSLEAMELMMEVENEFEVEIPQNDMGSFVTVKDFIDYLEKNLAGE